MTFELSGLCGESGKIQRSNPNEVCLNSPIVTEFTSSLDPEVLARVEQQLDHQFVQRHLLIEALTHSSFSNEKKTSVDNERLEFLGDAVIGLVIGEALWRTYPDSSEGALSRWRSQLVSRKSLAEVAAKVGMNEWILLGRGEKRTGGAEKCSILAGVFEAVVGALYLDSGLEKTREYILRVFQDLFQSISVDETSYRKELDQKTFLQEITQSKHRSIPLYRVVDVWGLEHEKNFKVEIEIEGVVVAAAEGRSKKEAEQRAAKKALESYGV